MWSFNSQEQRVIALGLVIIVIGCCVRWLSITWHAPAVLTHEVEESVQLISINEADYKQLDRLPGIGKTLAARIIHYRLDHGPYTDIHQLRKVKGMTEKVFRQIYFRVKL